MKGRRRWDRNIIISDYYFSVFYSKFTVCEVTYCEIVNTNRCWMLSSWWRLAAAGRTRLVPSTAVWSAAEVALLSLCACSPTTSGTRLQANYPAHPATQPQRLPSFGYPKSSSARHRPLRFQNLMSVSCSFTRVKPDSLAIFYRYC